MQKNGESCPDLSCVSQALSSFAGSSTSFHISKSSLEHWEVSHLVRSHDHSGTCLHRRLDAELLLIGLDYHSR